MAVQDYVFVGSPVSGDEDTTDQVRSAQQQHASFKFIFAGG